MPRDKNDILSRTAVVVPAYNAGAHLTDVIERVAEIVSKERIIVVDDGSSDDTLAKAQAAGVVVVVHPKNRGKGAALQSGMQKAIDLGMEFVVTLDADGQHDPDEIHRFAKRQAETDADFIVGNRMADKKNMPFLRVFANFVTSGFVSLRAGCKIPDSQNGYRMIRTSAAAPIRLETHRYDAESEILIKAGRAGARIDSVPVRTIYGVEKSGVNPFIDTLRFLRLAFKSLFW